MSETDSAGKMPTVRRLGLQGLTILLVEDSRFASDGLRRLAMAGGARLRRAESLALARRHLATYRPDVVIVDIGLPDGSGLELVHDLMRRSPGSPVVLALSGDPDMEEKALNAGALGFLCKPICSLAEFQQAVLRHLPGRCVSRSPQMHLAKDPLSLVEDLSLARRMLGHQLAPAQRSYLARFLGSLARETGDVDLAVAAAELRAHQEDQDALNALLNHRIEAQGSTMRS